MTTIVRWGLALLVLGWLSPVWAQEKITPLTTLQNTTSTGEGEILDVEFFDSVGLSVTISDTATLTLKVTGDGTNYVDLACISSSSTTRELAVTITASGEYQCDIATKAKIKVPVTANTGTVLVKARASTAPIGSGLSTGSGIIGTVGLDQTTNGTTNGVYVKSLDPCFDQTNLACRVIWGPTRVPIAFGGPAVAATDATTATWTAAVGKKTYQEILTCTGTCTQNTIIYGSAINSAVVATSMPLCTLSLSGTTNATASCTVDTSWAYYFAVTSGSGGTSPLATLYVMY